jgi:hypothetical protein
VGCPRARVPDEGRQLRELAMRGVLQGAFAYSIMHAFYPTHPVPELSIVEIYNSDERRQVKAIRIEPGLRVGSSTEGGIIDSDGEVIARGDESDSRAGDDEPGHLMAYGPPIQLTVDQGLATIFSPR